MHAGFFHAEPAPVLAQMTRDLNPPAAPRQIDEIARREQHLIAPVAGQQHPRAPRAHRLADRDSGLPQVVETRHLDVPQLTVRAFDEAEVIREREAQDLHAVLALDRLEKRALVGGAADVHVRHADQLRRQRGIAPSERLRLAED